MAQRINHKSCLGCIHLQKENPIISGDMALYQCTSQKRNGRCVGWVPKDRPDSGLNQQGGSCCNVLCPGDVVRIKSYFSDKQEIYLYCGKVQNRHLLYQINNDRRHKVVDKGFFRGQTGFISNKISVMMQSVAVLQANKRRAKKRKEKWLKEHG